ncbi:hypothetical protein Q4S45_04340 [Massilia sp. R2A-15]|uniref:hypothetical protein n=1 Tax=Massilia sp. R2A-15 TaxID=3064278 RepID=UPI00273472D4|nr:hypothetical protein [Massilia sp. R2A-15]WLI90360.1 hypothetical protein Q4S45_04340 [Massilia sp. R2A-15]
MAKQRLLMLILAASCSLTQAEEILVVGTVERILLLPFGSEQCPPVCQMATPLPDGGTRVCISNACGCEVTELKVDKVLAGGAKGATLQVKSHVGEWCRPTFPISSKPLLVQVKDGQPRWSRIEAHDGRDYFDAKPFSTIGAVAVGSLQDAQGKVRLDTLLEHLSQQR